jgi:hypothetical protein
MRADAMPSSQMNRSVIHSIANGMVIYELNFCENAHKFRRYDKNRSLMGSI